MQLPCVLLQTDRPELWACSRNNGVWKPRPVCPFSILWDSAISQPATRLQIETYRQARETLNGADKTCLPAKPHSYRAQTKSEQIHPDT